MLPHFTTCLIDKYIACLIMALPKIVCYTQRKKVYFVKIEGIVISLINNLDILDTIKLHS